MKKIIFAFIFAFSFTSAFAQWNPTGPANITTPVGINSTPTPSSMLSVNTPGDTRHTISAFSGSTISGSAAVYGEAVSGGFADHVSGLMGRIESGSGYTYGVRATATTASPSTAGRAYGVSAIAGNASAAANFGLYAELIGSNGGTAVLGYDRINFPGWSGVLPTTDTWAGYFLGDVQVTNNIGVQSVNTPQSMIAANTVGDTRHVISAYSDSSVSGSAAVYGEGVSGGFADHVSGLMGRIEAGSGYTYGVRAIATTTSPSTAGRAYGVSAIAGNASAGANFGLYAELTGSNGGTAVLGYDRVKHGVSWGGVLDGTKTWAGYFYGDAQVTDRLGIGEEDFTGISTAIGDPDYRLFVNGGIVAKKLLINSSLPWADYVFAKDYNLLSLSEVEAHIAEAGHLPNVPSAGEIEAQGGFEVGEMTINQQEKIEEIFLHLIEMNKKIETLETENQALKTQIATQK